MQAAPCLDLVAKRKDSILLFVLAAVDGESFTRLLAAHRAFAAVQVSSDLLPGLQSFLRGIARRHTKTPAQNYTRGSGAKLRSHISTPPGATKDRRLRRWAQCA